MYIYLIKTDSQGNTLWGGTLGYKGEKQPIQSSRQPMMVILYLVLFEIVMLLRKKYIIKFVLFVV
ncbi:MAG: hypothetical protein P8Y62_03445 [candidate division WOR-3 bacterium]